MTINYKFIDNANKWHLITEYNNSAVDDAIYIDEVINAADAAKYNCITLTAEQWNALKNGYIVISK